MVVSTGAATAVVDGDANIYKVKKSWATSSRTWLSCRSTRANINLYSATLHWNPGSLEIVSATSWSRDGSHQTYDSSQGTGSSFPDVSGGTIPAGLSRTQQDSDVENFSEDLHISSPRGRRIQWLLGSFYTHQRFTDQFAEYGFDTSYRPMAYFAPAYCSRGAKHVQQRAVFGDLTWRVTEHIDVTAEFATTTMTFHSLKTTAARTKSLEQAQASTRRESRRGRRAPNTILRQR